MKAWSIKEIINKLMFSKIFKITINTILFLLIILGIFVTFSFVPFPKVFGEKVGNLKVFTVQSGSMEPAIHTGSLIFTRPESDYAIGDVVTRKTADPKVTITHRIISKDAADGKIFFETKGDANDAPDGEKFSQEDIIGKEILTVPYLGYPVAYARTTQGLILLIIIPAVIIIYDEMNKIKAEVGLIFEGRKKKRQEEASEVVQEEK